MRNPTGKKLEKILFKLFDEMIEGVEQYNHNGSLWIIFTNERQWVVEYTEGGTLWYNYKLFKNEMELVGMDCVENKEYITRWFESRFLNKPKVDETLSTAGKPLKFEDAIQNGVKDTCQFRKFRDLKIEDTIQNGVKDTRRLSACIENEVEKIVQEGVKNTVNQLSEQRLSVEDTIENGVKLTVGERMNRDYSVKDIVENGIKNTYSDILPQEYDWSDQFDVENAIKHGEKIELK